MFAELEYGNEKIKVEIPDKNLLHVISSRHLKAVADPQRAILKGLEGSYRKRFAFRKNQRQKKCLHCNIRFNPCRSDTTYT